MERGLVDSINRPGGNATGVSSDTTEMVPKRPELLRELLSASTTTAILVSPGTITRRKGSTVPESETRFAKENGLLAIRVHNTPDFDKEVSDGFDWAVKNGARPPYFCRSVLLQSTFSSCRACSALRYGLPTVYPRRDYAVAGGLLSYAPSFQDTYRQIGLYAGRILKGAKPGDLPVVFPQKLELIVNLKTAKALNLAIPVRPCPAHPYRGGRPLTSPQTSPPPGGTSAGRRPRRRAGFRSAGAVRSSDRSSRGGRGAAQP